MLDDMRMRNLAPKTQSAYIRAVRSLTRYLRRPPDTATPEDLRLFQLHMADGGTSPVSLNATLTGLKFFFDVTLERSDVMARMRPVRTPRRLPVVLSQEEVSRLIAAAPNIKYQTALSVAYGAGLRVGEIVRLPAQVAAVAYQNKALIYGMLFDVAAEVLQTIAGDAKHLGARIGVTLVLHTWGSALTHHPHVHGIVPGGGLARDGNRWVTCRRGFFLPVRVLSRLFRRRFLEELQKARGEGRLRLQGELATLADGAAFARWAAPLRKAEWVVYAKRPFAGPQAVLAYLSRYTHRVAISNSRLIGMADGQVTFRWKDYRAKGRTKHKAMTLDAPEFIRRFLLHVLPSGFHRIRHYGLLSNASHKQDIARVRELLGVQGSQEQTQHAEEPSKTQAEGIAPTFICRHCGCAMTIVEIILRVQSAEAILRRRSASRCISAKVASSAWRWKSESRPVSRKLSRASS
jgi:hypothetical protein